MGKFTLWDLNMDNFTLVNLTIGKFTLHNLTIGNFTLGKIILTLCNDTLVYLAPVSPTKGNLIPAIYLMGSYTLGKSITPKIDLKKIYIYINKSKLLSKISGKFIKASRAS